MPTVAKTSAKHAKLGDLNTYTVSTSALPIDTADSAGSIPTVSATFVDGENVENLVSESFTITNPTVGKYDGDVVGVSKSANSNRYSLDVHNIMNRLNSIHRLYPLSDFNDTAESVYVPTYVLEYWTQQCGIFYSKIPGDRLFFQSQYGHYGAWAKDITRPLKSSLSLYSGSETFGPQINNGRIVNKIPRDSEALLTFPTNTALSEMGSYLPVLIPATPNTEVMVFGGTVGLWGSGREGLITWHLKDMAGKKRSLRVVFNTATGFTVQTSDNGTTFTSRVTVPVPGTGDYHFSIGLNKTATGTKIQLKVINTSSVLVGSNEATVTGSPIKDSMALTQVAYRGSNVGTGSALLYSDIHISLMDALPSLWPEAQKSITTGTKGSAFMVGFSGNVWEHIKQYCSIYHLDMNYRNGKLTIEPRQKDVKVGASLSELSTRIADREKARHVEVVNQQHTPTGPNYKVMWAADQVYQVAVGEVQEFTVQTDHSILSLAQPICVSGITPYPYTGGTGQYVVTGSDGYIVSPAFWNDQGGSITCDITENEGEIKVKIKGPDFDSVRAPYRISEGDAGRPALYITGLGVLTDPVTLKVPTGNSKAAKDVGTKIESPFIGNAKQAYDAAARASRAYATPEVTVSFAEPTGYDEVSKLGTVPAGSLVKNGGNIMRVTDASQTPSMLSGTTVQHNTIYQLKRSYGTGATVADMNEYNDDKPIGKVNLNPMKVIK